MANQKMVVFRGENQDAIINFKLENALATNKDGNTSFYQKGSNEGLTSYTHFPP